MGFVAMHRAEKLVMDAILETKAETILHANTWPKLSKRMNASPKPTTIRGVSSVLPCS
jgi:hypothetical protein